MVPLLRPINAIAHDRPARCNGTADIARPTAGAVVSARPTPARVNDIMSSQTSACGPADA
jgi:hypothetical protein